MFFFHFEKLIAFIYQIFRESKFPILLRSIVTLLFSITYDKIVEFFDCEFDVISRIYFILNLSRMTVFYFYGNY